MPNMLRCSWLADRVLIVLSLTVILSFTAYPQAQWIRQPSFTSDELFKIAFVDSATGWIVGSHHLYVTSDGGTSWIARDTVLRGTKALHVFDAQTALLGESRGSSWLGRGIRRTTDRGASWQTVDTLSYWYSKFSFVNARVGYAACGEATSTSFGVVRKTTDGGVHWLTIASVPVGSNGYDFEGISFVDSLRGWAIAYNGLMFHTTNAGASWVFQDTLNRTQFSGFRPMSDVVFATADSGWAVGGVSSVSIIARTTNGGATWIVTSPVGPSIQEIFMLDSRVGWIVGQYYQNNPLRTTNGGTTWEVQATLPGWSLFNSVIMLNTNLGWAVGSNVIYKTTNGGATYVQPTPLVTSEFRLEQNYPNPFNPTTTIRFFLPSVSSKQRSNATLKVYDLLGREIATLVNDLRPPGEYSMEWDASGFPSGVYFYRLQAGGFVETKKLLLIR